MAYLLNVVYLILLIALLPWLAAAAVRQGKYREGLAAKLWGAVPRRGGDQPCVWLHAVSVGEVNLLGPLLERLEREHPQWECVVSCTTKTGHGLARRKYAPRMVFYCPLDFSWAVERAMRRIRPDLLILAELELWPNLTRAARRRGVRLAVINGRLSDRSWRGYRRIRWIVAPMLRRIHLIAAQNEQYAQRFRQLGAAAERVRVAGSLKFDGAESNRDNPATRRLAALAGIQPDDVVFLAGSTQHPEESLALDAFLQLRDRHPRLRLILTPRHPERFDAVATLLDRSPAPWRRRSELDRHGPRPDERVLLVDAVGELGAWWGTAHIAFVGGSMGSRGGQNMIEPAAYGAAVSFGPNTANFRDIAALMLARQAAVVVADGSEMTEFVRRCLEEPDYAPQLGRRARSLVAEQQGAAERTAELISRLTDGPPLTT
jgi:3-deoxy-D-manno-octulosonic-acid transferase